MKNIKNLKNDLNEMPFIDGERKVYLGDMFKLFSGKSMVNSLEALAMECYRNGMSLINDNQFLYIKERKSS